MDNLLNFKKWIGTLLIALLCTFSASVVHAGDIVTEWSFSTWAEFSDPTWSGASGTLHSSDFELSWGADDGDITNDFLHTDRVSGDSRSALTIGDGPSGDDRHGGGVVFGTVETIVGGDPGTVGVGISATHWNNTISDFSTLTGATLTDFLDLDALVPDTGGVESAPTIGIDFKFQETVNNPGSGSCLDGSASAGYIGGCPDVFGFNGDLTMGIPFAYDGNLYNINILVFDENDIPAPFAMLDDGYCTALGLANGCSGLITSEKMHTTFQFGFNISHESAITVPEPSSIFLLAIAMIVLAANKRQFHFK
jgi:hypothetical protein